MAKNSYGEEDGLLLPSEMDAPDLVKNYIAKYRQHTGPFAKRNIRRSHEWFMQRITKDTHISPIKMMMEFKDKKTSPMRGRYLIGRMFYFKYDALHKDKLPYWDKYPLVFFFNIVKGDGKEWGEKGITYLFGLNMHYLPPKLRLLVFEHLITLRNERQYRAKTRLRLTWKALKRFGQHRLFQHCVKVYRHDQLESMLHEIEPQYWEVVLFMQTALFKKQSQGTVYRDARRRPLKKR